MAFGFPSFCRNVFSGTRSGKIGIIASLSLLSACGYHLRDQQIAPASLADLYVECPANVQYPVCQNLIKRLNRQNLAVDTDTNAHYLLSVSGLEFNRRAVSINDKAVAAEYEVSLSTDVMLTDADAIIYLDKTHIEISRTYRYNEVTVLSKEREETMIRRELSQLMGEQIVRRLAPFTTDRLHSIKNKQLP